MEVAIWGDMRLSLRCLPLLGLVCATSVAHAGGDAGRGMPVPWKRGVNAEVKDSSANETFSQPRGAQGRANAFFAPHTTFLDRTPKKGLPQRQFDTRTRVIDERGQVRMLRERVDMVQNGSQLEVHYRADDVTPDGGPRPAVIERYFGVDFGAPAPSAAHLWVRSRGNALGITDVGYYGILARARTVALEEPPSDPHALVPLLRRALEAMRLERQPSD
jgi:hypothetical protein